MQATPYQITAKIWLWNGPAAWHFISVPEKISKEIQELFGTLKRGWGSLPVIVTLGKSRWETSIFPDKKRGTYLLPLKAEVRKREKISVGDTVNFYLEIKL